MKLIDFYAPWCGQCKTLTKNLETLKQLVDIDIETINVEELEDLVDKYEIKNLPTLILVDDKNNVIKRHTGVMSPSELEKFIKG